MIALGFKCIKPPTSLRITSDLKERKAALWTSACNLTAGVTPTPSPTPMPQILGPTATPALPAADYAFHINFAVDQSVTCAGGIPCDSAYFPRFILYFRGDLKVAPDGSADGQGVILLLHADACQTLWPQWSSCQLNGSTNGRFTIHGQMRGDKLEMTLHLEEMLGISMTWTSHAAPRTTTVAMDPTYQHEINGLFENAHIFDVPLMVTPTREASRQAQATFEGEMSFGPEGMRKTHGFGSLFFISPELPLPEYVP